MKFLSRLLIAGFLATSAGLHAAPQSSIGDSNLGLTGNVRTDYWNEMTRDKLHIPSSSSVFGQLDPNGPQDPYHPAATFLPYIFSQNRSNGARLYRTAGGGNVAGVGLYDVAGFGTGLNLSFDDPIISMLMNGTITHEYLASRTDITQSTFTDPFLLSIQTADVVAGLETVVFQINIFGMAINEGYVTPFEMTEMLFPVELSINGGAIVLQADYRELLSFGSYDGGGGTGGDEAASSETWAFQWDLRGLGVEVTDFSVNFTVYPHSSTRGLRIDQSDVFTQVVAVPEPSTGLLFGMALALAAVRCHRRKRCA